MVNLKGWKYGAFIGSIVGIIGLAIYPIIIDPLLNAEEFKEIGKRNKEIIKQRRLQMVPHKEKDYIESGILGSSRHQPADSLSHMRKFHKGKRSAFKQFYFMAQNGTVTMEVDNIDH